MCLTLGCEIAEMRKGAKASGRGEFSLCPTGGLSFPGYQVRKRGRVPQVGLPEEALARPRQAA